MKKQMIIIFMLILSLAFILPVDTAMAAPLNWVKLDDFDSYLIDDTSGSTEGFSWETVEGSDGLIVGSADPDGDKYLLFGYAGTVDTHTLDHDGESIWFNSTDSHSGYYMKHQFCSPNMCICYYDFVNDTGDAVVRLKVGESGNFGDNQYYYHNGNSWQLIGADDDTRYVSWNYYIDNVIQYSTYDENFDLQNVVNDTACDTSLTDRTDYEVSDCNVHATGSGSSDKYHIIHEYGYIDGDIESPVDPPEVTGALVTMNGVVGVRDTILYRSNIFTVLTLGDTGRHAVIEITDPNDDIVYSSEMGVSKYILKSFHTLGIYTFRIYDYNYPTTGYDASSTFNVTISGHMTSYINQSGENFTRFYTDGSDCYYNDGEYPKIIFNISSDHKTEEGDFLLLRISKYTPSKTGSSLTTVTEKTYYNKFDQVVFDELRQTYLDGDSTYYAHMYIGYNTLWNVSWGPIQTYIATRGPDLVIASDVVEVCNWPTDENGTHVPPDEWDGGGGAGVELFPTLNDTLGGIVGLIVTMFLTLSPLIVAGAFNNQMGSNIQIPPLVYGITGALGVTISTIFGWFPSWSIFFIIGVGILIIAIVYFIGQRSES
jgi:hypothetical protein